MLSDILGKWRKFRMAVRHFMEEISYGCHKVSDARWIKAIKSQVSDMQNFYYIYPNIVGMRSKYL